MLDLALPKHYRIWALARKMTSFRFPERNFVL